MRQIVFYQDIAYFSEYLNEDQNFVRQLSSYITEKYNGYQTVSIEFARSAKKRFQPIDIIYKPTKNLEKPLCYFTEDILKAYHSLHSVRDGKNKHGTAYECYYCNKF